MLLGLVGKRKKRMEKSCKPLITNLIELGKHAFNMLYTAPVWCVGRTFHRARNIPQRQQ